MSTLQTPDVLIIGGGPAGVAAAVAARQAGARRVTLAEARPLLGGAVTMVMHRVLGGLYADEPAHATDTLNDGVQRAIIGQLVTASPGTASPQRMGRAWVLPFEPDDWQRVLHDQLVAHDITLLANTRAVAVRREADRIAAVQLDGDVAGWVDAPAVIDCAGGRVLALAGPDTFSVDPSDARMMGGYALRLAGLTGDTALLQLQVPYTLAQAVAADALPLAARLTLFHPGPHDGQGVCKLAVPPTAMLDDSVDARQALADQGEALLAVLRGALPAMADAQVIERSPFPLARDGRRLLGRATVTREQVLAGDDTPGLGDALAVRAWWPIERWDMASGEPTYVYGPTARPYAIPSDALRSAVLANVYAAGLAVSADTDAAASLRASGICLATGAAAGRLAVLGLND